MIKKYLPYVLLTAGIILLLALLTEAGARQKEGLGIVCKTTVIEAVSSIILMTFAISMLLKRV